MVTQLVKSLPSVEECLYLSNVLISTSYPSVTYLCNVNVFIFRDVTNKCIVIFFGEGKRYAVFSFVTGKTRHRSSKMLQRIVW
jgi:hypothetical protein